MEAFLDSSFIISCMKKKIDFLSQLEEQGFRIVLPREVFQELKDLRLKVKHDERSAIDAAFDLFALRKVKKATLGHRVVDQGLIAKGRQGAYIATLDKEIKREVHNRVVISDAQNCVIVERD
jgi:rRNA-processing protein FCF1